MRYSKDVDFAVIKRNKPIDRELVKIFSKSFSMNKKYFPEIPKKFLILICDSENEYKKYANPYYSKWSTAVGRGMKGITTRSPDFVERIGRWKGADFQKIMTHEISHVFWFNLCKTWTPSWFSEGFACYIGRNFDLSKKEIEKVVKKYNVDFTILDFRYLRRNFKKGHYPRYPIWQAFTNFLVKKYSVKNLKRFSKAFSNQPNKINYKLVFKKIFGKTDRVLFNEFLKTL